ncbi:DUF3251 domain-containing protein [Pantoea sp. BAV 3049]|uniref:DUF3251 domain-containing protein n=1 Tax=Pantoea sp. BAV 3049 TaxID=2654188 RepID=UPI00131B8FFC|nr:DUF3251 domain-containing protein [Pantoea sp. BAV 3049]
MTRVVMRKPVLLVAALLLAGCATPSQQPELNKLHTQVGKLNGELRQLTQQATALTQQNMLNTNSTQGAWLLPAANTAVVLKSQAGDVRLSLSHVSSEANGTRAILNIRAAGEKPLPAFTVRVEWGEMDPTTGKPLQVDSQSQLINVAGSLLPRSEVTIPLRLSNTVPEQSGYIRVHDLVVQAPVQPTSQP